MTTKTVSGHAILKEFEQGIPETTDVHCWYCTCPFLGQPIPCVKRYDTKRDQFTVYGVFCSWSCSKSFAIDGTKDWSLQCSLISFLRKRVTGKMQSIRPAPNKYLLEKFGGSMSIEEFRNYSNANKNVKVEWDKLVISIPRVSLEERAKILKNDQPSSNTSLKLDTAITNSVAKNESLKVKRSKPMKTNVVNLFTTMNIQVN